MMSDCFWITQQWSSLDGRSWFHAQQGMGGCNSCGPGGIVNRLSALDKRYSRVMYNFLCTRSFPKNVETRRHRQ
jgi:hypothetical protein